MKSPTALAIRKTLAAELHAVGALRSATSEILAAVDLLAGRGDILATGLGKSSYVAMKMAASLASFGIRAHYLNAVEALHGDSGIVAPGSVLVAFSYSGETAEVVRVARHLKTRMGASVVAVTGKPRSTLARLADAHIALRVLREGSPADVAPLASVAASLVAADLLTSGLLSKREFSQHRFADFHPGGSLGMKLRTVDSVMAKGKNVPLVRADAPLSRALSVMTAKGFGIVGVTGARGALRGVVTDGDLRRWLMRAKSAKALVRDAMGTRPKTVAAGASFADALSVMERYKITAVFAVDAKKAPVGLVHIHHLLD